MKLKYDKQADAIYIYLSDAPYSYGEDLDDERRIDYDKKGNPIGIELLCVSQGVTLDNLPHAAEVTKMLEAKKIKVFA